MNDQGLRDKFKFDEADLNANRNGRVTEKQQKSLSENIKKTRIIGFGIGCCFFIIALFLPFVAILITLVAWKENFPPAALGLWIMAVPWVLMSGALGCAVIIWTFFKSRPKGPLKNVVGPIDLVAVKHTRRGSWYFVDELHIGQLKFKIDKEVMDCLTKGDNYAVYFVDNKDGSGKQILSLEWLSKE